MRSGVGGNLKFKSSKKPKEDAILFTLPVFCEQRKMSVTVSVTGISKKKFTMKFQFLWDPYLLSKNIKWSHLCVQFVHTSFVCTLYTQVL